MTVQLSGATYRYAGSVRPALSDVDLVLEPGAVMGLAGANEAGKSTLCLVASGLAPAAVGGKLEGSVTLDGEETRSLPPHELAQRCGIVFQSATTQLTGTVPTVYEEVAFGPRNLGLPLDEIAERTSAALDALGIADLGPRDPMRLSGGQAQLVAIATILALRPRHLVLDEPTSQLDPQGTKLVGDALVTLAREGGGGLLFVEHKTDLLATLADTVSLIDAGRIVADGPAGDILAEPALERLGVAAPSAIALARALARGHLRLDRRVLGALGLRSAPSLLNREAASEASPELPPILRQPRADNGPLELDGVVFDYPGPVRALDGIELRIEPGETVAVVGQNGSGKSTLVRHLNGLLRPTEGTICVAGRDARGLHVAQLARIVALAFQDPDRQIFAGRVGNEVAFGPRNLGVSGKEAKEIVRAALAAVGLESEIDAHPYDLGYSRRKLLSLASVLALRSPVVVLDEPTTGQDARGVRMVERMVASLASAGRTVITITHDMRFAAENFSRVIVMRAGKTVLDGSPDAVFTEASWPALASTYLEPPLAAVVGSKLGLGSTPTAEALAEALRA